ncbi:MAG: mannose-6-phosphate isomerase, class I [Treponema sp.]|nr:mannose-6-phosphate isomerase, class I [Treponema sp.]
MPKNELLIDVLGCSLQISADEDPEYLQNLLDIYRQKTEEVRKTTGLKDQLKIAVLTGFLLCDELEKNKNSAAKTRQNTDNGTQPDSGTNQDHAEAEELTLSLISRLGDILGINGEKSQANGVFKLLNTVKYYDWGSPDLIPGLLGKKNESKALWAELWMGVHPEGPSRIINEDLPDNSNNDELPLLSSLIAGNPEFFLGKDSKNFSGLPFLFKLLAAEKPLSIQAHPDLTQAAQGWERENREGVPLNSKFRNYKDANHKPEIICALTPFIAMAGFRHTEEIKNLAGAFFEEAPRDLKAAVFPLLNALDEKETPLKKFLGLLLSLPAAARKMLSDYAVYKPAADGTGEWKLISQFARQFPGDPAVISPLYLNLIYLNPGEALFLPAGVLHAYVKGLGVELMSNSDNVLRGGLTAKHVDVPELLRILDFKPFKPAVIKDDPAAGIFRYPAPCQEFSLAVMRGRQAYPETGPSIILVTEGRTVVSVGESETVLEKGESAFIPANDGSYMLDGDFTLYSAGTGTDRDTAGGGARS